MKEFLDWSYTDINIAWFKPFRVSYVDLLGKIFKISQDLYINCDLLDDLKITIVLCIYCLLGDSYIHLDIKIEISI